jgi:hypothetical protein
MLCNDFIQELAVPTDDRDSAGLAAHLSNCPGCAAWAKRDAQFDRLWNATRPVEPSSQVWDSVWSYITSSFDSSTPADFEAIASPMATSNGSVPRVERPLGLTPASSRSRRWNWAAIGLIGLAQAAAVLLAVGWAWRDSLKSQGPEGDIVAHPRALSKVPKEAGWPSVSAVDIEPGPLVVIRMEDSTVKVVDVDPDGISYSVDDWFLVFNAVEDIAKPWVAMKE